MREHIIAYERLKLQGITTNEEIRRSYDECRSLIDVYGLIIDLLTIFQLFLSGISITYLIILAGSSNFSTFCRYFVKLSLPTDIFFLGTTFVIFLSIFTFTYGIYHIHWTNRAIFIIMMVVIFLLVICFFFNVYSLPMSIFLKRAQSNYGAWFELLGKPSAAYSSIYLTYRSLSIVRMVFLLIVSLLCGFSLSTFRAEVWNIIKCNM